MPLPLKVMFNDELFVRYGRGIQPTARAFQLFGSIRRALQLVQNELPGSGFEPLSSERVFHLCVCSPLDNYLTSIIYNKVEEIAPNINLVFKSSLNQNTEHQLRYQKPNLFWDTKSSVALNFRACRCLKMKWYWLPVKTSTIECSAT